ncbi:MAG: hypothetical protein QOG52_810 [Frankiaceae bacterium]|nr:hypothetical protein [Frankiaceae bacterium]
MTTLLTAHDGVAGDHVSDPVSGRRSPRWYRPSLLALLIVTAALYLWDLGASGWANAFYSAAVQAGATSWKAFFFGSFDASNAITVDKPPASLWVMELSARAFGVNAWSILVPQALLGVASVALLVATVRRRFGAAAGLIAGGVLALTPVAVLMFRFNNPDALLVTLLIAATYAMTRALEKASTRWILLAGSLIGFAFLAKMLQAFLVVPAFSLAYLIAAPTTLWRRVRQLLAAGLAMIASAGWWIAIVSLVPASSRPYIGGSQGNSVLELVWGYNGLGRITGNETGSVTGGGGGAGGNQWGTPGWSRMFSASMGGQISWLLPAALLLIVVLAFAFRRLPRTSGKSAAVILWGGWLLVTGATFSLMKGIIHEYYTVALAPAIGALIGIGTVTLWRHRDILAARVTAAFLLVVTAWWSVVLLERSAGWHPALRTAIVIAATVACIGILVPGRLPRAGIAIVAAAIAFTTLGGSAAYALTTADTPHGGSIVTAGPAVTGARGGPGGRGGGGGGRAFPGRGPAGAQGTTGAPGAGLPPATQPGQGGGPRGGGGGAGGGGGLGGLLDATTPSAALLDVLRAGAAGYDWPAAAVGSNQAAGVQLASGLPVMAIGGFNGSDNSPTLAQFQQYVADGRVHYFLANGGGGRGFGTANGGSTASADISSWVAANFTATTVGGVTVYDLTAPSAAAGAGA